MKITTGEDLYKKVEGEGRYSVVTKRHEMLRDALKNKVVVDAFALRSLCRGCEGKFECRTFCGKKFTPKELLGITLQNAPEVRKSLEED